MSELDILNLALQPIDRLSGGERQLVALAQAVASGPELILLDEPTSALDLARQFQVMRHVRKLAGGGAAVVAVLHDLSLAAQWADEVIVLSEGRFHQAGSPLDVIKPAMLAACSGLLATWRSVELSCYSSRSGSGNFGGAASEQIHTRVGVLWLGSASLRC